MVMRFRRRTYSAQDVNAKKFGSSGSCVDREGRIVQNGLKGGSRPCETLNCINSFWERLIRRRRVASSSSSNVAGYTVPGYPGKTRMNWFRPSDFLLGTFWTGWRRWATWSICISAIALLGALRTETDTELAFASLVLLPVLVIAWAGWQREWLVCGLPCGCNVGCARYCFSATIQRPVDSVGKCRNPFDDLQPGGSTCRSGSPAI